jgi:hypothetical protein
METFRSRHTKFVKPLLQEALDYIRKVLKQRGSGYELIDPSTYEDVFEDDFFNAPVQKIDGKIDSLDYYGIVCIDIKKNGTLIFIGYKHDCSGKEKKFKESKMSPSTIFEIADLVADLEK